MMRPDRAVCSGRVLGLRDETEACSLVADDHPLRLYCEVKRLLGYRRPRGDRSETVRSTLIVSLIVVFGTLLGAQADQPLPDVDRFGPQVGDTVPAFSLVDQRGQTRDLASLMGPNGMMLVFNRSADW